MTNTSDHQNPPESKIVCFCNKVAASEIQACIQSGSNSLAEIQDCCQAGAGPCGGSCRENMKLLLHQSKDQKPTQQAEPPPAALVEAVSLFNRHYFWECHEVLEHEWMDEVGPRRLFYQGLIQAAAAMYHVLNTNPQGCIRLAREARRKLEPYQPAFLGIALTDFLHRLEEFEIRSKEILGNTESGYNYERIPKLCLGDSMTPEGSN